MVVEYSSVQKYYLLNSKILKVFYFLLLISSISLILIVCFFKLDEIVSGDGIIRTKTPEVSVKTSLSGTINKINYKNTIYVKKNDTLLTIDCKYEEESLKNNLALIEFYKNYKDLYTELLFLLNNTSIESCLYDDKNFNNPFYYSFVTNYQKFKNELQTVIDNYEYQKALYPTITSKKDIIASESIVSQTKLDFSNWLIEQRINTVEQISLYSRKIKEIQNEILLLDKIISNSTIKASQSGFINEIVKLNEKDYVNKETEILTIIPQNSELKCIINISTSNISKLKLGQTVIVQIPDLPSIKYGKLQGTISLIPKDVVSTDFSYYPIEVVLNRNYMESNSLFKNKEKILLKIGTKVNAKIIVDSNTLFQYLIKKIMYYEKEQDI